MEKYYSSEENILQLVALMKAHGVRKVIASPGNTNITFVASLQHDPYFQIYSSVDERSAAYLACGLAEESGEPVALSCTGATAARNYPSGLTEAFYRKLPVLAITSSQPFGREGQLFPQYTDRNVQFNDIVTMSVQIPIPHNSEERWANNIKMNKALLNLTKDGGGPVHINIATEFSHDFSVKDLPKVRVIKRYTLGDEMPVISANSVCIFIGSHKKFSAKLQDEIDEFCEKYNGYVLCDQTSNYKGKYRVLGSFLAGQADYYPVCRQNDLVIHLGEITGSYYNFRNTQIWRVNLDGEVRDPFRLLTKVFEFDEERFFAYYNSQKQSAGNNSIFHEVQEEQKTLASKVPELPLSNIWMAQQTEPRLPEGSELHLGILNSLRSWNLFEVPNSVYSYSNVGGFGIDGGLSSCIGASLANPDKLFFGVFGDLATFYDMNVLGNRHIKNNVRLIVSNNGTGYEMHCAGSIGHDFGRDSDLYFSAGGHFGNQSRELLKHFAEDLGFEYIKAETKEEFLSHLEYFVSPEPHEKPILFEVFVNVDDDDKAYMATRFIEQDASSAAKSLAKSVLGEKGYKGLKKILRKD